MRIDHHAYQRATRIAGTGFLVQGILGLILLLFSRLAPGASELTLTDDSGDTALLFASAYLLIGLIPWLGLILLFKQHQLERVESLEHDEVVSSGSVFAKDDDEIRVAARRLNKMHTIWLPVGSLVLAAAMSGLALLMLRRLSAIGARDAVFEHTSSIGWAIAICLAFTAFSFIMSRFVAGMAKLDAWQNLRGGAAFMVGNALVCLAVGVGFAFRFFDNIAVITTVSWIIAIFMATQAAEIVLNFVLNLYRPRVPGEYPRPAFDSRVLSLLAAPDNIVRSINEAVNYQFGFDITSSWGYQLLTRSFLWLFGGSILAVVVLNMGVVVEPQQQAIKLSRGDIMNHEVHGSGLLVKLPWPFQSAEVHDVASIRELALTSRRYRDRVKENPTHLWLDELKEFFDTEPVPFLVGPPASSGGHAVGENELLRNVATSRSLVDCEIVLQYRIRATDEGLIDYLSFSSDEKRRRASRTIREETLRHLALREITQYLSTLSIDEVLAARRAELHDRTQDLVQAAFDRQKTGIEVVSVDFLLIRPHGEASQKFEGLTMSVQQRMMQLDAAKLKRSEGFEFNIGNAERTDELLTAIEAYRDAVAATGASDPEAQRLRLVAQQIIVECDGQAARLIRDAQRDRWVRVMQARAHAERLKGQTRPFQAFPELYRQRELMALYEQVLPGLTKTVFGIDASKLTVDFDHKELDPLLQISDALAEDVEGGTTP